ncbi:hypothetical protein H310_14220 [Aphanomyces invadans]|uniref:PH domain-containing protein n=1 Tax=Aphanomyces invadans TaxID=157072 RepID=A0A024TC00_9STRA|nr:hypothetical protein H310_14220 [Aphanomyces invadans]ETV91126.1 hypothetical protein H310_14220 [Aphanomyces invadans]|eukprot:XP_008880253.1 hypothetical protein H310_14220 [Aphanomyces invadans]
MSRTTTNNVKEGALFKQGAGGGLFKRKNWKLRFFELTLDELRYLNSAGEVKGSISMRYCTTDSIEIMPDSDRPIHGGTIWRIAISTPCRRLLVACASEDDMEAWVDALNYVADYNVKRTHRNMCKISFASETTSEKAFDPQQYPRHHSSIATTASSDCVALPSPLA